ncbi:hypothetical protein E5288_WYG018738 [Bos mutus]|uniref:Uncharacterized protein n=1 Tax=Bos mutus TaxID=72004 RepID=A0A6B0R5S7_9CETA|nr:hypothetical protein [Bos mutus]
MTTKDLRQSAATKLAKKGSFLSRYTPKKKMDVYSDSYVFRCMFQILIRFSDGPCPLLVVLGTVVQNLILPLVDPFPKNNLDQHPGLLQPQTVFPSDARGPASMGRGGVLGALVREGRLQSGAPVPCRGFLRALRPPAPPAPR